MIYFVRHTNYQWIEYNRIQLFLLPPPPPRHYYRYHYHYHYRYRYRVLEAAVGALQPLLFD